MFAFTAKSVELLHVKCTINSSFEINDASWKRSLDAWDGICEWVGKESQLQTTNALASVDQREQSLSQLMANISTLNQCLFDHVKTKQSQPQSVATMTKMSLEEMTQIMDEIHVESSINNSYTKQKETKQFSWDKNWTSDVIQVIQESVM